MGARRMRKCRNCRTEIPRKKDAANPYQANGFCGIDCMSDWGLKNGREQQRRAKERERRRRLEKLKTKSDYMREAQGAFNAWVRERDRGKPCVSCQTITPGGDARGGLWDCGHYRSVGSAPELRFCEINAHRQCKYCNRDQSGRIVDYRVTLRDRIGDDALAWLEGHHEPKRYTIDDLKAIKAHYRKARRELAKQNDGD